MDLDKEANDAIIPSRIPITASDIAQYRDLHPNTKLRKRSKAIPIGSRII
jgi:hypothetical protein